MIPRHAARAKAIAALAVAGLFSAGCVDRALIVRTTPPGARVTVNGHPAGLTPTEPIRFDHYGTYEILIEKDGYVPRIIEERLATPWHGRFPLDFFAEVLWPGRIVDHRNLSYDLVPLRLQTAADRVKLIQNAQQAKSRAFDTPR